MSVPTKRSGRCLCGAVSLIAGAAPSSVDVCHCGMCRRWGGSPLMSLDCGSDVAFEGAENIATFASSAWAERGFCSVCGTHLFYRFKQQNRFFVPAGLFGELGPVALHTEIFIDEKPSFYSFSNDTKKLTGAEVFAQFAPPAEE